METRGRKSSVAKALRPHTATVTPLIFPPAPLSDDEREVWDRILHDEPEGAFTPEHADMLMAYCRHVCEATVLSELAKKMSAYQLRTTKGLLRYEKILNMREKEVRSASSLATRLRITRQATYDPETVHRAKKNAGVPALKPWELDDDGD